MKYYYAFLWGIDGKPIHQFSTDKDALPPDALFVTSFTVENCVKFWRYVEQYAIQTGESVSISNNRFYKEWFDGELYATAQRINKFSRWFMSY